MTVVFLSSLANIRAAVRALRQGAVSFLEKPVDPEELGDAVAEGLERAYGEHSAIGLPNVSSHSLT